MSKPPAPLDSPCMASDTAFLEREYNARAAIRDHPQIFARWAEQGAAARRMRACEVDLQYGTLDVERLDIFHAHQSDAPLLVFIHGGYWRSLDKSDFSWIAPPLLQHGVAVALTNYGLAPQTSIEDIVRQQLKALGWLYRNARATAIQSRPHRRRRALGGWSFDRDDDGGSLAAVRLDVAEWSGEGWAGDQRSVRFAAIGKAHLSSMLT